MQGEPMPDARYAPPLAAVDDVAPEAGGTVLATRSQRLVAAILDFVIGAGIGWAIAFFSPWNPWEAAMARTSLWEPAFVDAAFGFGLFCVLHGYMLARRGQTLGKMVVGIRITRTDGSAASLARLVGLRYGVGSAALVFPVLGQVYGLVDALMIFRESRRCLHDVIADTIVVKA